MADTSQQTGNGKKKKLLGGCTGKGWKPGQSGNPAGGKPGVTLTERLRDILDQDYGAARNALINAGVKAALGDPANDVPADFRFWNAIFERMDGKALERFAAEGGPLFRIVAGIDPREVAGLVDPARGGNGRKL